MWADEKDRFMKIEELALITGVSIQTINNWYRWKKLYPEHELAKLLPDYEQAGTRQTRFWKQSDIWGIIEFRNALPKGRNGILGDVTQINARKKKEEKRNGTKES